MSERFESVMSDWREQLDGELMRIIAETDYPTSFKEVLEYAVFPGGKRIRPVLMLLWHEVFSPVTEYALRFACGIELLHSYSLIHDDMPCMDNDEFRRGKPSVHKKYGEGMALLAGDALMDLGLRILNAPTSAGDPSPFCLLSDAGGEHGLICGQYLDLFGKITSLDDLTRMYMQKTGALFTVACLGGFALGNNLGYTAYKNMLFPDGSGDPLMPDELELDHMCVNDYAAGLGLAFQIYDDLSEYICGERLSETSILNYLDLDEAKKLLNSKLNDASKSLERFSADTSFLRELLDKLVIV